MKKNTILILIIVFALLMAGIYIYNSKTSEKPSDYENSGITVNTKIYFSDETYGYLVAKNVTVNAENESEKYIAVLNKLIEGPEEDGLYPSVNSKTKVKNVFVKDGIATVDFSDTLTQYNTGGSSREMMCIYSVVNSLCEFEEIKRVAFTINGQKIETLGQFDMTEPYEKDLSMVK